MPDIRFERLNEPTPEIAEAMTRWENDPDLIPFSRPNKNQEDLERRDIVSPEKLIKRLNISTIYLIYKNEQLVGEMDYMVDPDHLMKQEDGTAWIGITIGEQSGRGQGIGGKAMRYLEEQIKQHGLKRIELGVFEFNMPALKLYRKSGFSEIGRIKDFTFWQGRMREDIRMEKYV